MAAESSTSPARSEPQRVLLVDDTPANLALLVDALHRAGYRPLIANGGQAALARLEQVRPAIILMDMRMPCLGGMETMACLQAHPEWKTIPVIFMTAVEEPEQKVAALAAGAVDYVTKPFHPDEVVARIRTHLRIKSLQEELAEELAWRAETERILQAGLQQAVLVAGRDGEVQFCTQRATQLLARYFPDEAGGDVGTELPACLRAEVINGRVGKLRLTAAAGELDVQIVLDRESETPAMLLFTEVRATNDRAPLRELGLSEREAEVLYWISEGKSNPEIGIILGVAAGTVKKHAENLFAKLDVAGRSEAMRIALDAMQQLSPGKGSG